MPIVKSLDADAPDTIEVSFDIPRSAVDLDAITQALADLQRDLSPRWPVRDLTILHKNPVNLAQWEITIAIGLATPLLKPLGEKLRDEAFKWLKRKFKGVKKRKAQRTLNSKRVKRRS
jgi:hypothetical protein